MIEMPILSNERIKEEIEKATVEGALLEVNHHGTLEEHELAIGYRVAEAQREQTLKAVGEWFETVKCPHGRADKADCYYCTVTLINQLKQGKMPE